MDAYVLSKKAAVLHTPEFPDRTAWRVTWDDASILYRVFPSPAEAKRFVAPFHNARNWKIWAGSYLADYVDDWKKKNAITAA